MPFRQLFFFNKALLGEGERETSIRFAELADPLSALWVCRKCGEIYAKAPVLRPNGTTTEWQAFSGICPTCPSTSQFEVPGSIWQSWNSDFTSVLPFAVLQQELLRHITHYERLHNGN